MSIEQSGFIFIICLFLGAGLGMLLGSIKIGGAIGLGLGIVAIAVFRNERRWK